MLRVLVAAVGSIALLAGASAAVAGWNFESWSRTMENHRRDADPIALVTLHNVRPLSQAEVDRVYGAGFMASRPAYAFRVKFAEVLRGAAEKQPLDVPFAFISLPAEPLFGPQSTPQQRAAQLEGGRALLLASRTEGASRTSYNVWPVSSFETDDRVQLWRKLTALWKLPDPPSRQRALLAGCRDSLPEFQKYCCRRIFNWEGGPPDRNAAEQLTRPAALAALWSRFVDPTTPLEVLASCDELLGGISPGWRTHPARYDVLAAALRPQRLASEPPGDSQREATWLRPMLLALSHFPDRARPTYRQFLEIIAADQGPRSLLALSHLSHLYRPHTPGPLQRQLNREIWERLVAALSDAEAPKHAEAAAAAIYDIARDYSYVGRLPDYVSAALETPADQLPPGQAARIRSWFQELGKESAAFRNAAATVERKRREGFTDLTLPTKFQVGEKVVLVIQKGQTGAPDPVFGFPVWSSWRGWSDEPLWVEQPPDWPESGGGFIVLTGTLAERADVPVFAWTREAPFGRGLPVPDGYRADEIRRRFVIVDAQGEAVE